MAGTLNNILAEKQPVRSILSAIATLIENFIMNFNQLILKRIVPLLKDRGIQVLEMRDNFFKFGSDITEINMSYNELDRTSFIEIGIKEYASAPYHL